MKRMVCILLLMIVCLLQTSCVPYTSTDTSQNHVYGMNEEIHVYYAESGDKAGTLKITEANILHDEAFESVCKDGTEEYARVVQVLFEYEPADDERSNRISDENFWISNSDGVSIRAVNPVPDCVDLSKLGSNEYILALREQSDSFLLHFNHDFRFQTQTTATIHIQLQK